MRNYELTLVFPASLSSEELQDTLSKLTSSLQDQGAIVMSQDIKGKRQLAATQQEALLAVLRFSVDPEKLPALEAHLKDQPSLLRFMLLSWAPKKTREKTTARTPQPAATPSQTTEEEKVELGDIDKKLEEIFREDNI